MTKKQVKKEERKILYFGEYPQTIKADDVTIKDEVDKRGYYLGSDGAYYDKIVATPYQILFLDKDKDVGTSTEVKKFNEPVGDKINFLEFPNTKFKMRIVPNVDKYIFSNGHIVLPKKEYYFKVEPIKWVVLKEEGGKAFVVADSVLDAGCFCEKKDKDAGSNYVPTAQYLTSKIRAWLNDDFLSKAFNKKEVDLMGIVDVDVTSLGYSVSIKGEIDDKVKLLSLHDVTNFAYGFDSEDKFKDIGRIRRASDYAIARGVEINAGYYGNNCAWWLATRSNMSPHDSIVVGQDGTANNSGYGIFDKYGVVPAILIETLVQEEVSK